MKRTYKQKGGPGAEVISKFLTSVATEYLDKANWLAVLYTVDIFNQSISYRIATLLKKLLMALYTEFDQIDGKTFSSQLVARI